MMKISPPLLCLFYAGLAGFFTTCVFADESHDWKKCTKEAKAALERNDWPGAETLCLHAMESAEDFGTNDSRYAESLRNLAFVRFQLRQYESAQVLYRRLVSIDQAHTDTNSLEFATDLLKLSDVDIFAKNFDEAEKSSLQAQKIVETKLGTFDPSVGVCLEARANVLLDQDKLDAAEQLYKQALPLVERSRHKTQFSINQYVSQSIYSPNQNQIASVLNNLALLYLREKKFSEAEPLLKRELGIYEWQYSKNSLMLAGPLYNLGLSFVQQKKLPDAEKTLKRLWFILQKSSLKHPMVGQVRVLLTQVLVAENKKSETVGLFSK